VNCSFCATQLPADAVYCAECGRPAMSRRARRRNEAAPSKSSASNFGRAKSRDEPAGLFGSRRRKGRQERVAEAKVAAVPAATAQEEIDGALAEKLARSAAVSGSGNDDLTDADDSIPVNAAAETQLTLGEPIELEADSTDAPVNELTSSQDQDMPSDEDGPYDEIADISTIDFGEPSMARSQPVNLSDLPAPNPSDMSPRSPSLPPRSQDLQAESDLVADGPDHAPAALSQVDANEASAEAEEAEAELEVSTVEEQFDGEHSLEEPSTAGEEIDDVSDVTDEKVAAAGADLDVESESEPEVEAETDLDPEADADAAAVAAAEFEPETEPVAESESEAVAEPEVEPEAEAEPAPLVEPEPLVEPAPLVRSAFAPDLSKLGRTEEIESLPEPPRVKPVRPLGEEPIFSTADRLRASAFAPEMSEDEEVAEALQEASPSASADPVPAAVTGDTAPRPEVNTGTQPRGNLEATTAISEASSPSVSDAANAVEKDDASESREANRATATASASETVESQQTPTIGTSDVQVAAEQPAAYSAPDDVCSQCGTALTASDIFCGSCGFVKHGIQPGARTPGMPSLDPFPWGTPSAPDAEGDVEPEAGHDATESETASAESETELPAAVAGDEEAPRDAEVDSNEGEPAPDADAAPNAAAESEETGDDDSVDFSSLAPPPMSHQRVDLAIVPPTSASSNPAPAGPQPAALRTPAPTHSPVGFEGVEEDIEDTRIVERSNRGTRFVLQFSTGDSVIVTGTGLTGRNPIPEPSENFDALVPITDPSKSVSKTHLEFGQVGGVFWISDRYSGNGTTVREPGAEPKRCEPGKRYRVVRGTRVEIGEQFFIVS